MSSADNAIYSLYEIEPDQNILTLNNNQIYNFQGLERCRNVQKIYLDNNPTMSFKGAVHLPNLVYISMKNTPISENPHFELMCLIIFGSQVEIINDIEITESTRTHADKLRELLHNELQDGMIIESLDPLKLISSDILPKVSDPVECDFDSDGSFQGRPLKRVVVSGDKKYACEDLISNQESSSHDISTSISSCSDSESDKSYEYTDSEKSYVIESTSSSSSSSSES